MLSVYHNIIVNKPMKISSDVIHHLLELIKINSDHTLLVQNYLIHHHLLVSVLHYMNEDKRLDEEDVLLLLNMCMPDHVWNVITKEDAPMLMGHILHLSRKKFTKKAYETLITSHLIRYPYDFERIEDAVLEAWKYHDLADCKLLIKYEHDIWRKQFFDKIVKLNTYKTLSFMRKLLEIEPANDTDEVFMNLYRIHMNELKNSYLADPIGVTL